MMDSRGSPRHKRTMFSTRFHPRGRLASRSDDVNGARPTTLYNFLHAHHFPQPLHNHRKLRDSVTEINLAQSTTTMKKFFKSLRKNRSSSEEEISPKTSTSQRTISRSATLQFPLSTYRDGPLTQSERSALDGAADMTPARELLSQRPLHSSRSN